MHQIYRHIFSICIKKRPPIFTYGLAVKLSFTITNANILLMKFTTISHFRLQSYSVFAKMAISFVSLSLLFVFHKKLIHLSFCDTKAKRNETKWKFTFTNRKASGIKRNTPIINNK